MEVSKGKLNDLIKFRLVSSRLLGDKVIDGFSLFKFLLHFDENLDTLDDAIDLFDLWTSETIQVWDIVDTADTLGEFTACERKEDESNMWGGGFSTFEDTFMDVEILPVYFVTITFNKSNNRSDVYVTQCFHD